MKRVKKTTRRSNLDFDIFQQICHGSYPAQIAKDLNISKQRVDYHISSLKERNLIEMKGIGVWVALRNYEQKESKKTTRVVTDQPADYFDSLDPDTIRGHAFQFKLEIPKYMIEDNGFRGWNLENRRRNLDKLKIDWKPLKLFGGGERIDFRKRKIHLTNKSIIIYEKSSYFAETSKKSQAIAAIKILYLIKALERKLRASFSINGKYKLRITRQHYSLIKNALAIIYNKPTRKKLEVYDEKGLWLLIDNSWNLEELECVHPETSVDNADGMKGFMNSMKRTNFEVTPDFILNGFNNLAQYQINQDKNIKEFAVALNRHIPAYEGMASETKHLHSEINNLGEIMKDLKEEIRNIKK